MQREYEDAGRTGGCRENGRTQVEELEHEDARKTWRTGGHSANMENRTIQGEQ